MYHLLDVGYHPLDAGDYEPHNYQINQMPNKNVSLITNVMTV